MKQTILDILKKKIRNPVNQRIYLKWLFIKELTSVDLILAVVCTNLLGLLKYFYFSQNLFIRLGGIIWIKKKEFYRKITEHLTKIIAYWVNKEF